MYINFIGKMEFFLPYTMQTIDQGGIGGGGGGGGGGLRVLEHPPHLCYG